MSYEKEQEWLKRLHEELLSDDKVNTAIEFDDDDDPTLGNDIVEVQDINTDSEQDMDEDEVEESNVSIMDIDNNQNQGESSHSIPVYISKDSSKWRKHVTTNKRVRTRADNIVVTLPGVKGEARELSNASKIWGCFITDSMLENIVENTNIFIAISNIGTINRTARPTDLLEIRALLGLLYIAGINKASRLHASDLFKTNGTSLEIFRLTMSQARFRFLLSHIRFDDKRTREERKTLDKLAPIREFFENFNSNLPKHFSLSAYTTVDEMLPAFRGRCPFRIYMPSKPNRYGIKMYSLVDAKLFYTAKIEIYTGTQPPGPYKVDNSNISLLPRICQPIWRSKRNVTMDNFFTSKLVADKLLNDYKITTLGTIRKNKREIPAEFKITRPEKTSMFAFQEKCTLVSYIPKPGKNVLLLSTMHNDDALDELTGKPEMIMTYNETKGGVDVVDKMCEAYNCTRGSRRWPMTVFYTAMNIAGINSFVIYKCNQQGQNKIPRRIFLEALGMELIDPHIRRRALQDNIPRAIKMRLREICDIKIQAEEAPRGNQYGRCYYCDSKKNRKTKYNCQVCKKYLCLEHIIPVCNGCSEIYNQNEDNED